MAVIVRQFRLMETVALMGPARLRQRLFVPPSHPPHHLDVGQPSYLYRRAFGAGQMTEGCGQPVAPATFFTAHPARNVVNADVAYKPLQIGRPVVPSDVAMLAPDAHKLAGVMRFAQGPSAASVISVRAFRHENKIGTNPLCLQVGIGNVLSMEVDKPEEASDGRAGGFLWLFAWLACQAPGR